MCGVLKYSIPLIQYLMEPPFAAITAASHLANVSTTCAHLETDIFARSLQNSSSSFKLDGERLLTAAFRSCQILNRI